MTCIMRWKVEIENHGEYLEQKFCNLELENERLEHVLFEQCEFINCNFTGSCFTDCRFVECTFLKCNLSLISIPNSRFSICEFNGSKLVGVDWTKAHWPRFDFYSQLSFKSCILSGSNFFALKLHETHFDDCRLHDIDFRNVELNKSVITDCDLSNSLFMQTNLTSADLTGTHSFTIDIRQNTLKQAKFSRFEALELLYGLDIQLID